MPESYRKERPYPGQGYRLKEAAAHGLLIICRCMLCRRPAIRFLASDLAQMLDADDYADTPPFPCSHCGRVDYIKVSFHLPNAGDYGHLVVRRPAGVRHTQLWANVKLGDEVDTSDKGNASPRRRRPD